MRRDGGGLVLRFSMVDSFAGDVQVQSRWCKGAEVQQRGRGSAGEVAQRCRCRVAEVPRCRYGGA